MSRIEYLKRRIDEIQEDMDRNGYSKWLYFEWSDLLAELRELNRKS